MAKGTSSILRQKGLTGACGANEQDVGLLQLDVVAARPVHLDALVVVVDGDRELLLGDVLTDDVLVQESPDFGGLGEMLRRSGRGLILLVVLEDRVTDTDALVADVSAGIVEISLATASCDLWQNEQRSVSSGPREVFICGSKLLLEHFPCRWTTRELVRRHLQETCLTAIPQAAARLIQFTPSSTGVTVRKWHTGEQKGTVGELGTDVCA
jgi:hypothetical protein